MQHGCHTIKISQKKGDQQNSNIFKLQQGSTKDNSTLAFLVPFHKAFQKGRDTSQKGATSSSASHWCLHHEARHPSPPKPHKKEQLPSSASAAPRESPREQGLWPTTLEGRPGWKKGQFILWLTTDSARQSSEVWLWRGKTSGSCWR